jgi:hypothetical protein
MTFARMAANVIGNQRALRAGPLKFVSADQALLARVG